MDLVDQIDGNVRASTRQGTRIYLGQTIPGTATSCSPGKPWQQRGACWASVGVSCETKSRIRWQADVATKPPWTARQNVTEALIAVVVTS